MPLKVYTEEQVRLIDESEEQLKQFHPISAAGGVVLNSNGEILMIFRRGKWDLPKGKREDNEPMERCAERETKEETGLTELTLQRFLIRTYHTYTEKKRIILKDTHWYLFSVDGTPALTPQTEEDIFKAEWVAPQALEDYKANTYLLIRDVLKEAGF
jgi:8-oxo-dGTP pyrophosphatase MutT (NUDIX family)